MIDCFQHYATVHDVILRFHEIIAMLMKMIYSRSTIVHCFVHYSVDK